MYEKIALENDLLKSKHVVLTKFVVLSRMLGSTYFKAPDGRENAEWIKRDLSRSSPEPFKCLPVNAFLAFVVKQR
jgi:hypothetical protein